MLDLPIYPINAPNANCSGLARTMDTPFYGAADWKHHFAFSARYLLDRLLATLQLKRDDQIAILTTTDAAYVSTCVSITSFNHATISRVITKKTRVAIIIHEFGYIYPNLAQLCTDLRSRDVLIIEDCAHIFGAENHPGRSVGSYGDYALFSLPKVLPVRYGGLLRQSPSAPNPKRLKTLKDSFSEQYASEFRKAYPLWRTMNDLRWQRYKIFSDRVGAKRMRRVLPNSVPWMVYIENASLPAKIASRIELGASLLTKCLLLPTNPLVPEAVFERVADALIFEYDENRKNCE